MQTSCSLALYCTNISPREKPLNPFSLPETKLPNSYLHPNLTLMAVSSFARASPSFDSRPKIPLAGNKPRRSSTLIRLSTSGHGMSSLILRFPPKKFRQLSNKARHIGVAKIVAASWSDKNQAASSPATAAKDVQIERSPTFKYAPFFNTDGSIAIHAGERLGRGIATDAITTPVVNSSAYFFKKTADLIDFKEKRSTSYEYGRYGNYTTTVLEEKISALEGAESTVVMASGMCAGTNMLMALVPAGGHIVTTTDCYRWTGIFIENFLSKMGISATVLDPADVDGLESALENHNVTLFFTESPTNPFLRCVDIERVSKLCHAKGALVCIDGTYATPLNQKALALGADIIIHSGTKYIAGHNDVLLGTVSGPEKLVSTVRNLHHILGGTLNPNAAYLIIRGMKTLHLRVQQQNSTAQRMADILEAHPKIRRVYYPGLESHPEHHLAKKQMSGFGGVVSFEVDGDLYTTAKFVDSLKIPYIAPSFGGCESIVDQPAIMSYWDLPQADRATKYGINGNLVRFSFGIEDFGDLKADIIQALEMI